MAGSIADGMQSAQALSDDTTIAITNSAPSPTSPVALSPGTWLVSCDVHCRFIQGGSGVSMSSTAKGNYLAANTYWPYLLKVTGDADKYVTARTAVTSATGNIFFTKLTAA